MPFVNVANEVINQWDDWFNGDTSWVVPPVFTKQERQAVLKLTEVLDEIASSTADPLPELSQTQALPQWTALRSAAIKALQIFLARGRLPEDSMA